MQKLIDKFTDYCKKEAFIKPEEASWFKYGLEKRLNTIIVGIPFLIIAFLISNFLCAISFFATYFFVRKYIGGYHAKTVLGCIVFSLMTELIFLGGLNYALNTPLAFLTIGLGTITILKFAPYNHPNMHLSPEEISACRKTGRWRICIIVLLSVTAWFCGKTEIVKGCSIGTAMAAALLCLGYIYDWRQAHHEKRTNQKSHKSNCGNDVVN